MEGAPQKSPEMKFIPASPWSDQASSGYCRVKPEPDGILYDAGGNFRDIRRVYQERLADMKREMLDMQRARERAMKALASAAEKYLNGAEVQYWARSKSRYVPAVIEGVKLDLDRHYDTEDLYLKIQVMGVTRLVHVNDVCFSAENLEQLSRAEFLGE